MSDRFEWNDLAVEMLKQGLENGQTFPVIAAALGCGRNAAIGKAHRMGLKSSNPNPRSGQFTSEKQPTKSTRPKQRKHRFQYIPPSHPQFEEKHYQAACETVTTPGRKTLMQLKPYDCRWPEGTPGKPDFFFCGSPAPNQPYCKEHSKIAFRN